MANDGLKHVVHRRVHLERSQPEHRKRKVGQFLEKKTDYKKRSERYHVREKLIKELAAKTRFRNEDEFNFKMIHSKIGPEGQVILESEESARKRKLSKKAKVKNELKVIDTNMFILNHKQNVINKRLDRVITSNVGIIAKRKLPEIGTGSREVNGNRRILKKTRKEHIIYESSDSDQDTSKLESTTSSSESTGTKSAKSKGRNSVKNTVKNTGKNTDENEQLLNLSDMFDSKKQLEEIRTKLEDKRNLTVAKYRKKQVKKVRNRGTKIHEYPTERLK